VEKRVYTKRALFAIALAAVILFLVILSIASGWIVEWLWMGQLGYEGVFWEILSVKWAIFGLGFVTVFLTFCGNLLYAAKTSMIPSHEPGPREVVLLNHSGTRISPAWSKVSAILISLLVSLIFALTLYPNWDTYLRFRWGANFGSSDPRFGKDFGFYLFQLPFYELIQNSLTGLTLVTLLVVAGVYLYTGVLGSARFEGQPGRRRAVRHLTVLSLPVLATWGWGDYLDRFELLYSNRGVVYGVGYTAYHLTRFSLWVMVFASAALGVLVAFTLSRYRPKLILAGVGGYFFLYFLSLIVVPGLIQKFKVEPSELELETPFLRHNIGLTRHAYQLDRIEEKTYPALNDLTLDEIYESRNQETIQNVRLWDWRPMLQTYRQTQEIRLYYEFYEVDVGRYRMKDGYHQVMLSARELAPQLPEKARTWVNERLQFTHGYGLVMNFVSKSAEGGFPLYVIENIPPSSDYDLQVDQAAIYYGEKTPGYRIVATGVKEFDFPKGNQNVYTRYQGKGGIPLDSLWKRILFAWTQSDINILLTSYLLPESRIQIWRQVKERVGKIAPFLQLDKDPYLVLSNGRLYWIQDAYTLSDRFPYSTPYDMAFGQRLNYIRNAVKVIVDIYEGSVLFYIMDPEDPVLELYRKAFPGMFKTLDTLSQDLKGHLRYPEDLFGIQADLYRTYHMRDPQVFYNQEDLWAFPQEKYAGTATRMIPYYILMRLPDTEELQYLLMTPFTPQNRDNMIGWMAAKCDFPQYGKVLVYALPKEKLTLGPIQIEATIDQNTLISGQLSLWDQRGSRVIRGNLVVIPIDNAFLYVEPVYLTAEGTEIPQLKRVIVVSGNKVAMEPTLDDAVKAVFGVRQPEKARVSPSVQTEVLTEARNQLEKAQKAAQQGDWKAFGRAMDALKQLLTSKP
jgi:uncharacterized membrane protein (UPF0182 family)